MKKDLILENAKDRDQERVIKNKSALSLSDLIFLKSSTDIGTIRNMGRRGSNFAPEAILSVVKKLSDHDCLKWSDIEIGNLLLEEENFDLAQNEYISHILALTKDNQHKKWIHLGGGHDHVYPFLMGLNQIHKHITVINIDAHLDTRTDSFKNSGTPFRQFAENHEGEFTLIQIGIHDFANTKSTMTNLPRTKEVVATYEDIIKLTNYFTNFESVFNRLIPYDPKQTYVFSLDADALCAGVMEGVSAVNHRGLPYHFVEEILNYSLKTLKAKHFGIYEYNPVYDNLSQKGARALAGLIYQVMDN